MIPTGRLTDEAHRKISGPAVVKVRRAVDLIHRSFAERITLDTVAMSLRMKGEPLGRLFQAFVGMSVHDYLTKVRLEHAGHFLCSGVKVEAVALTVGYRSKKNFYRQFLRHYGVTPEAYRRQAASEEKQPSGVVSRLLRMSSDGLATYAATFDHASCVIHVEPQQNIKGGPNYVATPFVAVDHGIQPFAASSTVEIAGETEADALERAVIFLEHRFGERTMSPKRQPKKNGQRILAPRP